MESDHEVYTKFKILILYYSVNMRCTSKLISLAILLHLCNSLVMELRLYLVEIFEDQCTGNVFDLLYPFISISHPRLMISVSKNFVEFFSMVNFMFA